MPVGRVQSGGWPVVRPNRRIRPIADNPRSHRHARSWPGAEWRLAGEAG
jgi:hypothetical protein